MGKVLIAHEDPHSLDLYRTVLEKGGHWVLTLTAIDEVTNRILSHQPDVILLSARVPGGNLSDYLSELHRLSPARPIPLVMICSSTEANMQIEPSIQHKAQGVIYEHHTSPEEISNVVQNLMEQPPTKKSNRRFLHYGQLELDRDIHAVRFGVLNVTGLPKKHFELLWLLAKHSSKTRRICPRELILSKIWTNKVRDREVDVLVSRLRDRLPFLAAYIETIPGKGYRFILPSLRPIPTPQADNTEKSKIPPQK